LYTGYLIITMRKNLLATLLFVCFCSICTFAQKLSPKAIPLAVRSELMRRYPDASKATWEKRGANYRAIWGGKVNQDNAAVFTPAGAFVSMSNPTDPKFLPVAITSYVQMHYHSSIVAADKSLSAIGKMFYEVKTQSGKLVTFSSEGRFIKAQ
jgi:hypothetical protein